MVELKNVFYLKINNVGIDKMSILTSINVSCRSIYSMELSFVFHTTDVIKRFFFNYIPQLYNTYTTPKN